MNIPDEYIEYCKSLSSTQMNFEFMDSMSLQDSMEDEYTGRNLASTGYKNLSNIGIKHGSLLVTFIFFFILLLIVITFHLIIFIIEKIISKGEESGNCLKTLRGWMEFGLYFYIVVFTSPFMFLVSLNEIAAFEVGSGFKAVSYVFSVIIFCLLLLAAFLPIISLLKGKVEKHFFNGLRDSWRAKLFYTSVMIKFLSYSIIFILISSKEAQLTCFFVVTLLSSVYLVHTRPFEIQISNIMIIMNEGMLLLIGLLMIAFMDDNADHKSLAKIIMGAFSANILICFVLALGSQIYSL